MTGLIRVFAVLGLLICTLSHVYAAGALLLAGPGGVPPPTNLRITNTGAFRIINTAANRAVFP